MRLFQHVGFRASRLEPFEGNGGSRERESLRHSQLDSVRPTPAGHPVNTICCEFTRLVLVVSEDSCRRAQHDLGNIPGGRSQVFYGSALRVVEWRQAQAPRVYSERWILELCFFCSGSV